MDYEAFKQEIMDQIKEYLPNAYADANVSIHTVIKNNDQMLDGLVVSLPDSNIAPTIYLNPYFEEYDGGKSMDDILAEISAVRIRYQVDKNFDVSRLSDWNLVQKDIVPRVVDGEHNDELLASRPHTMMDGMAVTYCILVKEDIESTMSAPITNELMASWGITTEQLHQVALENLPELMPASMQSMNDFMAGMMFPDLLNKCGGDREEAEAMLETMLPKENMMYIVSNESKMYGAATLLNSNFMGEMKEQLGGDFYILPSSVHEILLVPKDVGTSIKDLELMVQEINATEVAVDARLSNHVFAYDAETKEIYRADHEAEHQQAKEAKQSEKDGIKMNKSDKEKPQKSEKAVSIADRMKAGKEKMDAQVGKPKDPAKKKETMIS